ncbi:NUDIX hydrolase [uncultured Shewanella sp.]|uniref:NUDIX hydrolase n=1 Tax=uncultured Shewanella sp. TaxID=173975 RepID=UPI00260EB768|nr:NUDIX hydrolase [uncultured Shewanella sp.]
MMTRYKPNTTVACIIHCGDQYLMVKECINNQIQYNQPAGHLEANESLIMACQREVKEETGLAISPEALVGIYQFTAKPDLAFVRYTFCVKLNKKITPQPQDNAILSAKWLTFNDILALKSQLRSPLVLQSIRDYQTKPHYSLDLLNDDYLSM